MRCLSVVIFAVARQSIGPRPRRLRKPSYLRQRIHDRLLVLHLSSIPLPFSPLHSTVRARTPHLRNLAPARYRTYTMHSQHRTAHIIPSKAPSAPPPPDEKHNIPSLSSASLKSPSLPFCTPPTSSIAIVRENLSCLSAPHPTRLRRLAFLFLLSFYSSLLFLLFLQSQCPSQSRSSSPSSSSFPLVFSRSVPRGSPRLRFVSFFPSGPTPLRLSITHSLSLSLPSSQSFPQPFLRVRASGSLATAIANA